MRLLCLPPSGRLQPGGPLLRADLDELSTLLFQRNREVLAQGGGEEGEAAAGPGLVDNPAYAGDLKLLTVIRSLFLRSL